MDRMFMPPWATTKSSMRRHCGQSTFVWASRGNRDSGVLHLVD